jgi:hypothetical protein
MAGIASAIFIYLASGLRSTIRTRFLAYNPTPSHLRPVTNPKIAHVGEVARPFHVGPCCFKIPLALIKGNRVDAVFMQHPFSRGIPESGIGGNLLLQKDESKGSEGGSNEGRNRSSVGPHGLEAPGHPNTVVFLIKYRVRFIYPTGKR